MSKYLSAGRGSEFYKEALALLIKIEEIEEELEKELGGLQVTPENMCEGKPVGSSCWMALIDQPECYVWNSDLQKDETVTWSGACSDGFAQGREHSSEITVEEKKPWDISRTAIGKACGPIVYRFGVEALRNRKDPT